MRVLAIDDDPTLRVWVQKVLSEAGYQVDVAASAEEGRALSMSVNYDLVLVDLDLPDRSGLSVVYAMRRAGSRAPIVIMTGRDDEDAIVGGLDAGADDYLIKPVPNGVLRARVRAQLRRAANGSTIKDEVVCGNVTLSRSTRRIRVDQTEPALTEREFSLLAYFLERPEDVITRSDLLERVWSMRMDTDTNVVDATICRLRGKLRDAHASVSLSSVRGRGYRLSSDAKAHRASSAVAAATASVSAA